MRFWFPALVVAVSAFGLPQNGNSQTVDFNRDVRPIISNRCLACHGPDEAVRQAGLRLDDPDVAVKILESGSAAVVPGKADESELIARITSTDESLRMPPAEHGKPLTEPEIEILRQWIQQGAHFAKHWSYVKPVRPAVPVAPEDHSVWSRNPIDSFVLQRMIELKLEPSDEADARSLVRRVWLDLTGLPPTVEEGDEWSAKLGAEQKGNQAENKEPLQAIDDSAYEELVDHLLNQPEFGEHWARKWLDLARYADSSGYADDPARTIWPWRDWVIRAINSNMPFDQFTVEQMAGDLLPNPTEDQIIATAFHRNTMTNNEGGTQDEEFRNVAVVDRVNTTMAVWMGTTIACAQCHSHKFDPITQEEFFSVFAILNNTEDADRGDDSPRLQLYTPEQAQRRDAIQSRLAELDAIFATPTDAIAVSQQQWEQRLLEVPEWLPMKPTVVNRLSGGESQIRDDGTVSVLTAAEKDVYTIEIPLQASPGTANGSLVPDEQKTNPIAAIQIESLPSASLPGGGSGHGGGNFVITELKLQIVPQGNTSPVARFVRIEIPGKTKILSLAEVQVYSAGVNLAPTGKATQSSTDYDGAPALAIDGSTDGQFEKKSVTHTAESDDPWWEVDLGASVAVEKVAIWNRTGSGIHKRLADFRITLLNEAREEVWNQQIADAPNPTAEYTPSGVRDIALVSAVADYEQTGFAPEEVFDGKTESENGWAVGGRVSEPHALTLVPASPISVTDGSRLRVTVEQNSPYANHVLGEFRIRATGSEAAVERARLPQNILAVVSKPAEHRSQAEQAELANYFRLELAPELADARKERKSLRQEADTLKPDTSVPILKELAGDARRKTLFQYRGNYLDKGHEVREAVPSVFPQISQGEPVNRLTFAKWLVSEDNPLTARVIANRFWEHLFGRGIVGTSEDFGSQGERPTHPELLDWLARELIESGWDTKALLKLIVTSSTYRQSAKVSSESAAADPDNRWLARGPRLRLSAEMVRDQALLVSGLLSKKMYGAPVKPPQPNLGLSAAFGSSTDWQTSMGEDRYRRAVYTTWRRSNPYPSMATFDAPNREVCTLRRTRSNTPLQALVTMNDPVYVEAAQALARVMLAYNGSTRDQITVGFRRCVLRPPTEQELAALEALFQDTQTELSNQTENAVKLATDPLGPLPEGMAPASAAAMTVVGNVLLNLDEMFLKR